MRRKEQAAASRAALVDAARHCFTEHGYERTTVAAILERAGMARGALYHYFPGGKREIFTAVFEAVDEAYHDRRDALFVIESPLRRIRAGIEVFLELCTDDEFARIVLIDAPDVVPSQRELGTSYRLLLEQLREATEAGEVQDVDPETMAIAIYGAARAAGERVATAPDRARAAAEATTALHLLLDGLAV